MTAPTSVEALEEIVFAADSAATRWRQTPALERAAALSAIADALDASADELVPIGMRETNLPEARLRGELTRTTFQLRLFAEVITEGGYLDARIDHADPSGPWVRPGPICVGISFRSARLWCLRRATFPSRFRSLEATPPPRSPRAAVLC
ncbi:aldehyde dehydrogenase family protein [Leucobacter coleopterorum]|uniref:aldehyde dehydrogenase family protein n=1 Tax=Leucobacter coleopterorum TaxID=2714933 RepID=UPI003137F7EF